MYTKSMKKFEKSLTAMVLGYPLALVLIFHKWIKDIIKESYLDGTFDVSRTEINLCSSRFMCTILGDTTLFKNIQKMIMFYVHV